jgi:hypothetical protein
MARKTLSGAGEPSGISPEISNYSSALSRAFSFYHQGRDKKDAIVYLKDYTKHKNNIPGIKALDSMSDSNIDLTMGWVARIITNGNTLQEEHVQVLDSYIEKLVSRPRPKLVLVKEKTNKPTIQDYMQDKISEVLGELEGVLDDFVGGGNPFDLYNYLKANSIPRPYCSHIEEWTKKKARDYIHIHQEEDKELRKAYSSLPNKRLVLLLKMLSQFLQDLERFSLFKKANRKPKAVKIKPPIVQVAKLKYKKIDESLNLKSVNPAEMVGASQVWVYNSKYKKLAVYRSDAAPGIQVKGSALQNYMPEASEQKALRKPAETLKYLLTAGKIQLRKIITDLTTKVSPVTGRLNEDCVIVRVIK